MNGPLPPDDDARLSAMRRLALIEADAGPEADVLVELAADLFDAPIAIFSYIDADRQVVKAARGMEADDIAREVAFCSHVVASGQAIVVPDLAADPRFATNPIVRGLPNARFYAGTPVRTADGHAVGALCVLDTRPRASDNDRDNIERLGRLAGLLVAHVKNRVEMDRLARAVERGSATIEAQTDALTIQKRVLDCASALARMGAWERDGATGAYKWSEAMYALHEVDHGFEITDGSIMDFYPPRDRARVAALIEESVRTHQPFSYESGMITAKGKRRWVRVIADIEMRDGVETRRFGMKQDITDEVRRERQIARLAQRDAMTGLHNRAHLIARMEERLSPARPDRPPVALLLIDLDGFKDVNDTHGHAAGDVCLKRFARRLRDLKLRNAVISRVGGDEFAVFLEGATSRQAVSLAAAINAAAVEPIEWREHSFELSTSIGIAHVPGEPAMDPDELMREADLALYEAKNAGKDQAVLFDERLRAKADRRARVIRDIRAALATGRMVMHYQPKVELRGGTHAGFESLIRWNAGAGRVLGPDAFQAALDDAQLSRQIGAEALRMTLDQARDWMLRGLPFGTVAVNLGAGQFRDPELADVILSEIARRELEPGCVELEVTEGVLLSRASGNALAICHRLKQAGVRIAFDDFGTGFASLTHLREFPVDVIKIDRSFVDQVGADPTADAIVTAITGLARTLGLEVVAEGVETAEQVQLLLAMGCTHAQGFFFGRPAPAEVALSSEPSHRRIA